MSLPYAFYLGGTALGAYFGYDKLKSDQMNLRVQTMLGNVQRQSEAQNA